MAQDRMSDSGDKIIQSNNAAYQAPDIDASLSRASNAMKKVRVIHGANEHYFDNLEGKTVGMVRKSLRDVFNIPSDAEALIGGNPVGDEHVLEASTCLEFQKSTGTKGISLIK